MGSLTALERNAWPATVLVGSTLVTLLSMGCPPSDGGGGSAPRFVKLDATIATGQKGNSALPTHPEVDEEFDGRLLIFYGATDYETDRKDNFGYEVVPDPDDTAPYDARLIWERGGQRSLVRIRDTVIGLPPEVEVSHRRIYRRENAFLDVIDLPPYPEGFTGIVLTEVLGHISNGDDDHGYWINTAECRDPDPEVRIRHGFDTNAKNELVVRVTQLRWPSTLNIVARCPSYVLPVTDDEGTRTGLAEPDPDSAFIPELSAYWPHYPWRVTGSGADDDMAYEYRVGDAFPPTDGYLEGRYTNRGYLQLTVYELDLWAGPI
jgi:hypothetical protein